MEDMFDMFVLMASSESCEKMLREQAIVKDASERFDKRALLQIHDDFSRELREPQCHLQIQRSVTDTIGDGGTACPFPLERLNPVSFTELKIGEVHHGQVVYGTLCAQANRMSGIMTLLEDDNGLAVRLAIYNAAHSQADIKRLYPMGAKVAIKEPYFKIGAADGLLLIRVDNPTNVVNLEAEKGKRTENLLDVDLEDARIKGNICFRERNWDAAAEHYTKCIDAALFQLKEGSSSCNDNVVNGLLNSYSNRAETWLQMKEFEWALEDSNDALRIDPSHLKALYRKGRALLGLRHYRAACEGLMKADKNNPGHKEIQEALGQAKTLYAQSLNGKYDISDYLLRRGSTPPEVADFVGPLEIKMTEDGRGRGLYATREIMAGQLLLVCNAVAIVDESAFTTVFHVDNRRKLNTASQEDLVATVVSAARKSQRLLCQLYSLLDSPTPGSLNVPPIDLFKTDGQMSEGQEVQKENLLVDVNRIRDIVGLNSFGGTRLHQQEQKFSGLWLLPSFINHSCVPNSSWLDVGSAMFIHASKPIERGEEITFAYFDALVPLPQRRAKCRNWGFKCKCRRCILERSLRTSLGPLITLRFDQLHDKTNDLIVGRFSQIMSIVHLLDCAEFAKLFIEAEEIIRSSHVLKSEEEKRWIRASFVCSYFLSNMLNDFSPSGQEIMEAIQSTVPGDFRNLSMAAAQLKYFRRLLGNENETVITRQASDQAREACISVFGRQSEDVLKALVIKYSK